MRYILLIYSSEAEEAERTQEENEVVYSAYFAFSEEVRRRGVYQTGDALQPTSMATTVRVREDKILTTDGPFAETKEQLGGFYILDCANLDEAIELAAKMPTATNGSIEIRPIIEFE